MSTWTYQPPSQLAQVRLYVADTNPLKPIFMDDEVNMALQMESSQNLYVSGMANPTGNVTQVPVQVTSVLRAAALLLDALAANKARLAGVMQILDVKLSLKDGADQLRKTAASYRDTESNQGHFAIAEMVWDQFSARERVWKQFLRIEGN